MTELLELAAKYGGLLLDVIRTLFVAHSKQLTEQEILDEVARIKARELSQIEEDWRIAKGS